MAELQIARAWEETGDDGKVTVHVHAYEVVSHQGQDTTLQYTAVVAKGAKKPETIHSEIAAQLRDQRAKAKEATPEHVDHTAAGGLFDTTEAGAFATKTIEV